MPKTKSKWNTLLIRIITVQLTKMTTATLPGILNEIREKMDASAEEVYYAAKAREIGPRDHWTDFRTWDYAAPEPLSTDAKLARERLEAIASDFVTGIATIRMYLNTGNLDLAISGIQALLGTAESYKESGIEFSLPKVTAQLIGDVYNTVLAKVERLRTQGLQSLAGDFANKADILRIDAQAHGYQVGVNKNGSR